MRILHVSEHIYRSSGVSVWCCELCNKLYNQGHFVKLALQYPDFREPYPVSHEDILTTTHKVVTEFNKNAWNLVHINGVWNWPYHQIASLAARYNIPVVWSPHGSLTPWALRHKRLKKMLALALYQKKDLKKANLLHVTAQSEVEDMRQLGLENKIAILPLGVNPRFMDDELVRIKSGVKSKHILFVSRIHPKKGIGNLIKAWGILRREAPSLINGWCVDIVGEEDFPGYIDEMKQLARAEAVEDAILFHGPVYGYDKEMLYAQAQLFVLPSYSENFGSVVIEALANATPVITTKGTPWAELNKNGCGWWIDIGVQPLVDTLKEALSKSLEELLTMGENGRKLVKNVYTWDAVARQMESAYRGIVHDCEHL